MIPEEELHDPFEPAGDWAEVLVALMALEGMVEHIGAWARRYRRTIIPLDEPE